MAYKKAPVLLFAYNRPYHLRKTLDALKLNRGIDKTEVHVFVDGAKNQKDAASRKQVLSVLDKQPPGLISRIVTRDQNIGLAASILRGVTEMFDTFSRVIVLEDDIVTSRCFIDFMNRCLDKYDEYSDIMSVSGYLPDSISRKANELCASDVFLVQRSTSWGWATWKESWHQAQWQDDENGFLSAHKVQRQEFSRLGQDLLLMMDLQKNSLINSWAIRWAWSHYATGGYAITPLVSLTDNIGMDGSGTHTRRKGQLSASLRNGSCDFDLPTVPQSYSKIDEAFRQVHKPRPFSLVLWKYRLLCVKHFKQTIPMHTTRSEKNGTT